MGLSTHSLDAALSPEELTHLCVSPSPDLSRQCCGNSEKKTKAGGSAAQTPIQQPENGEVKFTDQLLILDKLGVGGDYYRAAEWVGGIHISFRGMGRFLPGIGAPVLFYHIWSERELSWPQRVCHLARWCPIIKAGSCSGAPEGQIQSCLGSVWLWLVFVIPALFLLLFCVSSRNWNGKIGTQAFNRQGPPAMVRRYPLL